jgi:hypothetical protein
MSSAAKTINAGDDFTSTGEGAGARETEKIEQPSGMAKEQSGPSPTTGKGWKGGYTDTEWLGNPNVMADRQFASAGGIGYFDDVNITYPYNDPEADLYMVPNFQGASGQGANQSTLRPIGSV